jgi:hypothetical protein
MKHQFLALFCFALTMILSSSCKKTENNLPGKQVSEFLELKRPMGDSVITPFGIRHKSQVHLIDSAYHLAYQREHLVKVQNQTGKIAEDFGIQIHSPYMQNLARGDVKSPAIPIPGLGSGWITYAQNDLPIAQIHVFSTDWLVPNNPPVYDGQLLYLFNGLEDGSDNTSPTHILQPVLQFGPNGLFGGNYWTINNWYASCQSCPAYYGTPVTVTPGTHLQGVIIGNPTSGGMYSYTSHFWSPADSSGGVHNYPTSNSISVNNVQEMKYVFETMEAYNMQQSSNYPDGVCRMQNIVVTLQSPRPSVPDPIAPLNFIPVNRITDVGQHTTIVTGSPYGPEVDLFFH